MEKVTVLFRYQPGRGEELLEELRTSSEGTRAFQGCGSVDIYVDADDPDTVLLLQEWESRTQCERWIAWRIDTGLHDAVMEFWRQSWWHPWNCVTSSSIAASGKGSFSGAARSRCTGEGPPSQAYSVGGPT